MLVRIVSCGLLMAALAAAPAAAQAPAASQTTNADAPVEMRPALPTIYGDTGLWFVPTAEVLPAKRWSASVFRANYDRRQGLTDINQFGITAAIGLMDRLELFGSYRMTRLARSVRDPTFVPSDPRFGGVSHEFPYPRRGWSKNLAGPGYVGAKWNLISQSRGDAFSVAPRLMVQFPGVPWSSTNAMAYHLDLVSSRELAKAVEVTGLVGALLRNSPEEFGTADGISWGLGATFPTRSRFRALVEWEGELIKDETTRVRAVPFYTGEDGSIAPAVSPTSDPTNFKAGAVFQAKNGWFAHAGMNYSLGTGKHTVGGQAFDHDAWGFDVRIGWHPGTKVYVPPPPPEPIVREVVREVPAPAPPAPPPPNRNPTFSVGITCDPCVLEPGQTSRLGATATDPDGDPLTYRWTPQAGTLNSQTGQNVIWTAPANPGNVQVCVTASDNRGGSADNCITLQVVRRQVLMFEDVHFDFDKYNLKPEAVMILDAATSTLQMNPNVRITVEGHCDSIGTVEYNLALGERRANVVRDYLVNRGIANGRLRTVSYGEERPKADNNTAEGRAINRRAALVVIIESQ